VTLVLGFDHWFGGSLSRIRSFGPILNDVFMSTATRGFGGEIREAKITLEE
jgi:hypothetical protein